MLLPLLCQLMLLLPFLLEVTVIISSIIEKEEAGTVQREEKEVSTAASHNLAKNILANCHF